MFRYQPLLFACTIVVSNCQTFFHTSHGDGGSFTSVSHGHGLPHQPHQAPAIPAQPFVHHQAHAATYGAPAPAAYHAPAPATYHAPAPAAYHAPAAHHAPAAYHAPAVASYHAPAQTYHAAPHAHAAAPSYGEKCAIEYVDEVAEVCLPTLETKCEQEDGGEGVELRESEECHDVVRTVCVERHNVVDNEVCAYSYTLKPVHTEALLVVPHWAEVCHQETICLNPHHAAASYGAPPAYCHEEIHETCHLEPVLEPAPRPVTVSLPQPVEVCINKQVVLPYLECEKVKDRHCMVVPRVAKGHNYQIDKCTVELGEPACQESPLHLPAQACLQRIDKVKTVYEESPY